MDTDVYYQLVVLGNGFDLSCGLRSSFNAFFEPRMKLIEECKSVESAQWVKSLRDAGLTAWDLILYAWKLISNRNEQIDWCDVEGIISHVVMMDDEPKNEDDHDNICIPVEDDVTVETIVDYFSFLEGLPNVLGQRKYTDLVERGKLDAWSCGRLELGLDGFSLSPNASTRRVGAYLKITYQCMQRLGAQPKSFSSPSRTSS